MEAKYTEYVRQNCTVVCARKDWNCKTKRCLKHSDRVNQASVIALQKRDNTQPLLLLVNQFSESHSV